MQIPTCKAIILFVKDSADQSIEIFNGSKKSIGGAHYNWCVWRLYVNPVTWCVMKINRELGGEKREKGESKWMVDRGIEKDVMVLLKGVGLPMPLQIILFYFLAETYIILLICI